MSLLHPALLFGLGLTAIPILLHLLLRAKPKRLMFPALRLIQQNRRQNVRRMRLRHLWLLFLRVMVIGLIVFALTRPSLPPADYALATNEWMTLAGVLSVGLGTYFGVLHWWKRLGWSRNLWLTRRTILRGCVGAGVALMLLFGVGWPYARRVSAEMKDPVPKSADNLAVAAIFLFDNSPSMGYRQGNQTRLQAAQVIARDHLSRLPAGSKIAVSSSNSSTAPAFSLDFQSARSRVDAIDIQMTCQPLNDPLRTALHVHDEDRRRITAEEATVPEEKRRDRYVREIYLFTDLTRGAWRDETSRALHDELARHLETSIYLIDVGEKSPTNAAITGIKPSRETVPAGSSVLLDVNLSATGQIKPELTVEFFLSGSDGKLIKRGQQTASMESGIDRKLMFEVPHVEVPFQQGEFRIVGADPLLIDDVGYFTVRTLPPLKILVVAENSNAGFYWQAALEYVAAADISDFHPQFLLRNQLAEADLKSFDVIYLVNLAAPDDALWSRLHDFVQAGGGLGIILGAPSSVLSTKPGRDQIDPVAYNSNVAKTVVPADLKASSQVSSKPELMDLRNSQHVFLKRLEESGVLGELGATEVRRYWKVVPHDGAVTVAKYDGPNASPAILERRLGQGRVMLMTTSVDNNEWNDFVGTALSFVFADQLSQYLSQQASQHGNFQIGDDVIIPFDRDPGPQKIVIRMPDFKQRTQDVPAEAKNVILQELPAIGSYQVDSIQGNASYHAGFSLRLPTGESDLRRWESKELDNLLGKDRYSLSHNLRDLVRTVIAGRLGQEMYSLVVGCLVAVFALEQFTATWFYRTDDA